jgi:hypothetical protein
MKRNMSRQNDRTAVKKKKQASDDDSSGEVAAETKTEMDNKYDGCDKCSQSPCVWLAKKEEMAVFDNCEHGHLLPEDCPPNNVRRKKVYRQMFLSINEGPSGAGVRIQLPKCVEDGVRLMLPSPSSEYMGFKTM